jgi:hypothetical protein
MHAAIDNAVNPKRSCPICPDGQCPVINTRPDLPEPSDARILGAQQAIPEILTDLPRPDGRFEAVASTLVEWLALPRYGSHNNVVAQWAIHRLIQDKKLSAHTDLGTDSVASGDRRVQIADGSYVAESVIIVGPKANKGTDFHSFIVRGEEALWSWWRNLAIVPAGQSFLADTTKPAVPYRNGLVSDYYEADPSTNMIRFRERWFPATPDCVLLVEYLIKSYPDWFPTEKNGFSKAWRLKKRLEKNMPGAIDTGQGKGYRLKVPPEVLSDVS